jgi:predicted lipoprotein with Yx(FWY)xxD motif
MGAALGVALLAAAACSTASSTTSSSGGGSTASGSSATGTVISTRSGSAGSFLTDATGHAVYLWVADTTDKSTCSGACAGAWPPVPATGTVTASGGAVASDLSTITRSDGSKQVAYNGHPLYFFSGDSGAGQTNGQGSGAFGAKWWLVAPSGTAISGSGATATPSTRGGY